MSKRPSKLSRTAKSTNKKTTPKLNTSADEFKTTDLKLKTTKSNENDYNSQNSDSVSITSIVSEPSLSDSSSFASITKNILPPCPFCGKPFKSNQDQTRTTHLKSCGLQLGLGVDKLLEVKKLEDIQAEQWRALNLPKASNVSKSRTTISNSSRTKTSQIKEQLQLTGDPHLDMALALSASMASNEDGDKQPKQPSPKKCWLPQPPPSKVSKAKAKTALQVRTDQDRAQQITESVMNILSRECEEVTCLSKEGYSFQLESKHLECLRRLKCELWKSSALTEDCRQDFYVKEYLKFASEKRNPMQSNQLLEHGNVKPELSKTNKSSKHCDHDDVGVDWGKLLKSSEKADVTIYVRDEKELKAHSLVFFVRCKDILEDIIEENNCNKILSWPNVSLEVAKSFLKFLYCGTLELELETPEDFKDAENLCEAYPKLKPWVNFVQSIKRPDFGGFIEQVEKDEDDDDLAHEPIGTATQNLSQLLNLLEDEEKDKSSDDKESDEEWDEMCNYLTQKSPSANKDYHSNCDKNFIVESGCETKESIGPNEFSESLNFVNDEELERMSDCITQKSPEAISSPYQSNDKDLDANQEDIIQSVKRKSSMDLNNDNLNKKSRIEDFDEDFTFEEPNASVYSRRLSSPSINLTGFDEKEDKFDDDEFINSSQGSDSSDVLDSSIPELTQKSKMFVTQATPPKVPPTISPSKSLSLESSFTNESPILTQFEDVPSSPKKSPSTNKLTTETPKRKSFSTSFLNTSPSSPTTSTNFKNQSFHTPSFLKSPNHQSDKDENEKSPFKSPKMTAETPMPNYESMLSPALRHELRRFGLKVIPRRKAVPLLKHIFEETHPTCRKNIEFVKNTGTIEEENEDVLHSSQDSLASQETIPDVPEESILRENEIEKIDEDESLASRLILFIQNDVDLHRQTLMYEPIWLEDLFQNFKEQIGVSVKLNQIQTILDNECITFRTRSQNAKNVKRNAKLKK